jgi:hypothetical protein
MLISFCSFNNVTSFTQFLQRMVFFSLQMIKNMGSSSRGLTDRIEENHETLDPDGK